MRNFYSLYIKRAIKFLGSIKFAFILVICLIIISIIGSIVSDTSIENLKHNIFISLFFDANTDSFREFASSFGLLNIYTSPLFIIVLSLFTLNLLICTFSLFPFARKGFPFVNENALIKQIYYEDDLSSVTDFFYKEGWYVSRSPENNNLVKVEHNKPGKYGVIITHFGIIFIMLGAFIGHYFGFSGYMVIYENNSVNKVEKQNGEAIPLNFYVKLNKFNIDFYEGTKTAKAFTSNVSIIENDEEVKNVDIDVNKPLKYKDVVFYQASYGQSLHYDAIINILFKYDNITVSKDLKYGKVENIDKYEVMVQDFYFDLAYDKATGKFYDKSKTYSFINPAVYIVVHNKDEDITVGGWLPLYAEEYTFVEPLNMFFKFTQLKDIVYTGLSVKYNPGISIVYLGGVLLCFGVIFIYLLNYTAIIFTVSDNRLKYRVFTERRFPLVNPANRFYKHFNIDREN